MPATVRRDYGAGRICAKGVAGMARSYTWPEASRHGPLLHGERKAPRAWRGRALRGDLEHGCRGLVSKPCGASQWQIPLAAITG